jgi:hypothetical protein
MNNVISQLVSMLLPEEISLHFQIVSIKEESHGIVLRLEELPELVPNSMFDLDDIVLDGFCNPVELLHYSIQDRPLYLKIYRRRWKQSGSEKHYSNRYDLHPEGVKATHRFASFLKDEVGLTPDEYLRDFLDIKS